MNKFKSDKQRKAVMAKLNSGSNSGAVPTVKFLNKSTSNNKLNKEGIFIDKNKHEKINKKLQNFKYSKKVEKKYKLPKDLGTLYIFLNKNEEGEAIFTMELHSGKTINYLDSFRLNKYEAKTKIFKDITKKYEILDTLDEQIKKLGFTSNKTLKAINELNDKQKKVFIYNSKKGYEFDVSFDVAEEFKRKNINKER